ncbi:hypothetical protein ZHAS_00014140 [Anopheles sinensis]|uniref:Uncharacterized protein n=1 Tax=Anopheles sinensis TaxID=74873 RepID=A0A084W7E8_ANOSI|nr:hypothetical protein ZHAS_00014140 [Anopheles sinensis]
MLTLATLNAFQKRSREDEAVGAEEAEEAEEGEDDDDDDDDASGGKKAASAATTTGGKREQTCKRTNRTRADWRTGVVCKALVTRRVRAARS